VAEGPLGGAIIVGAVRSLSYAHWGRVRDPHQEERADDDDEDEGGGRVRDGHGKRRRKPNPRFTDTARPPKAAKATEKGPLALDALLAASLALGVQDHGGVGTGAAAAPGGVKHVGDVKSSRWVTLRARWVTLRALAG
jgi:hypothetical protein